MRIVHRNKNILSKLVIMMGILLITSSVKPAKKSVAVGKVQKVAAPREGKITIGNILATLNRGYMGKGTFLLITNSAGAPIRHEDLLPGQPGWQYYGGSKSVDMVFGASFTTNLPKNQEVTLVKDLDLINKMQADWRLPSGQPLPAADATFVNNARDRIFLYFVYPVNGVNYRFYVNDPFPGRKITRPGKPPVYPASSILDKFDLKK